MNNGVNVLDRNYLTAKLVLMKDKFSSVALLLLWAVAFPLISYSNPSGDSIRAGFLSPPADCWPHTRWWWPGNPLSKDEITRELEEMSSHGIRGVEQITMGEVYEKGNISYLSPEFMDMLKHTVSEAKRLGMEVSLNFGGPGWIIGGAWVPEEEKSKDMVPTAINLTGSRLYKGALPDSLFKTQRSWERYAPHLDGTEKLLAVIAGKMDKNGTIDERSIIDLTSKVVNRQIEWQVPQGEWKLMAFWLKNNGIADAVDHFSKTAMEHYCDYLGGIFYQAVGSEFGKTVESLFADSFELPSLASGFNWSDGLLEEFHKAKGYDLTPYLPAIWWQMGNISPKIRYDVNEFLHETGLKVFFDTFLGWCKTHHIQGRIQTYGFNTDNIQAAGMTHIPEMEITAGEKDAADWFDTRIGPKQYVASGAHIYGRKVVSSEVYTFIHWERYRETLEELKIASDGYLLEGATKFYNHGFNFSPEHMVTPTRSLPFAAYIQPENIWWNYYPQLAQYIARSSYLLRQGDYVADIALYSPLASQWTKNVLNMRKWTREFEWGELGGLIKSNGYSYDLVNDDALQNLTTSANGKIQIGKMEYKILILPNVESLPVKTLQVIEQFVDRGGVVIALERLPEYSTGLKDSPQSDEAVRKLVDQLFRKPKPLTDKSADLYGLREPKLSDGIIENHYGRGRTFQINKVMDRQIWWDKRSSTLDPFLEVLRTYVVPDFGIDFAYEGLRKNEGLTFTHRKVGNRDFYFVCNIQDKTSAIPVTFRTKNKTIRKWNPYTGEITELLKFSEAKNGIKVPLTLSPYESMFLEFLPEEPQVYVAKTDFKEVKTETGRTLLAFAEQNGVFNSTLQIGGQQKNIQTVVDRLPAPLHVSGSWEMHLPLNSKQTFKIKTDTLFSWTDLPAIRHFSGTGSYKISFELPAAYLSPDVKLLLDLGKVGNVAEVVLNGKKTGIVWMRDQKLDISAAVRPGVNNLEVKVTNTLINRVSSMTKAPEIPSPLIARFGTKDKNEGTPREFGFKPLPASGLMGPVQIIPEKVVKLKF